jgi:hypothetical protein
MVENIGTAEDVKHPEAQELTGRAKRIREQAQSAPNNPQQT